MTPRAARLDLVSIAPAEYRARIDRARAEMERAGIDALLIASEANFSYFSGLRSQSWASPTRPMFLLIPAQREPIAIVPAGSRVVMQTGTWLTDLRTWSAPNPADDGVTSLIEALRECSGRSGRIGGEFGPENQLRMPIVDFWRVQEAIQPAKFVDASAITRRIRLIKSPAEIARIRAAAQISSSGFERLSSTLVSGLSERDACLALQLDLLTHGMDRITYMIAASGPGGYATINSNPSDRILTAGDVLIIDTAAPVDGYFCDFDRNYAFGTPEDGTRRAFDRSFAATDAGIDAAIAGARACDIWQAMARVLGTRSGEQTEVGRMGHGIGLNMTEPPSIHPADETLLEPGMVLAIEPSTAFRTAAGRPAVMVHEENIVITQGRATLLSHRAPDRMPVIGDA